MTSLRDQLKKLATPATKQLRVDVRKRPSLIYDRHEAAKIDFSVLFETAKEAFDHLCNIDSSFKHFEKNLFAEDSIRYEPSIQDPEVHAKTGKRLRKFLVKISAFLQIPTLPLQVLEWLVQRFQVHLYHPDDVMRCVFPHHETALFPKVVQLLDLDAHDNRRWAWLRGIADKGIPLTKDELLLACSRDSNLLLFICHSLEITLKINRRHPQRCQPALVLFTQVALGLLTRPQVTEAQIAALLVTLSPALETGLGPAALPAHKASAFLLLQSLNNQVHLKEEVARRWLGLVLANPMPDHPEASLMLAGLLASRHGLRLEGEQLQLLQELEESLGEVALWEGHLQVLRRRLRGEEEPEVMELEEDEAMGAGTADGDVEMENGLEGKKEKKKVNEDSLEKKALRKKMKSLSGADLVKWLICTALGGGERPNSVVPQVYALKVLRDFVAKEDSEVKEILANEPVVPWLLLLLLHRSALVREAALSCLEAVKSSSDAGGRAKVLRKILKVKDRRLLVDDRLLLLQAPFNLRILTECCSSLRPERLFAKEAPNEAADRRAWLFVACSALELLDSAAAVKLQASCPQLGTLLLDLLEAHRPDSPGGAALWGAWKSGVLGALPADLQHRGLDRWLDAASVEPPDSALRRQLAKMEMSVAQVKRLLTGLLPKKSAMSARDLIQRKRTHATRASSGIEAQLPRLLCLLEALEERRWTEAEADAPLWSLVPTFMDCLTALAATAPQVGSPKRRRRPSSSSPSRAPPAQDSDASSDEESEVIADYEDDLEASTDVTRALAVRYLLSALLGLLRAIPDGGAPSDVPLEPLLDCLAGAFDRQVRQSALLVVSEAARLRPALLLHNLLPLLTFMRRHVFPLDDAFTLQVIGRVLDCVVPAYIRAGTTAQAPGELAALRVLAVLADSFHHVPGHRRLPLFAQLGCSVVSPQAGGCFAGAPWPMLALLADRLSRASPKDPAGPKKRLSVESSNFLCRLLTELPVLAQVRCTAELLRFLRALLTAAQRASETPALSQPPNRRRTRSRSSLSGSFCEDPASPMLLPIASADGATSQVLEMVSCGPLSERQALAHALGAALASHLASPAFLSAFVNCPRRGEELTAAVEALLDETFQLANLCADRLSEEGWRSLLSVSAQLLDKVHAFLPFGQHLAVVLRLCDHSQAAVQRKALELLHGRLTALPGAAGGPQALTALTPLLLRAADVVEAAAFSTAKADQSLLRQTALLAGKELTRLLAGDHPKRFHALLTAVTARRGELLEPEAEASRLRAGGAAVEEEACAYILTAELLQRLDGAPPSQALTDRLLAQLDAHRRALEADGASQALQLHRTASAALLSGASKAAAGSLEQAQLKPLLGGLAGLEADWPPSDRATLARLRAARRSLAEAVPSKPLLAALGGALRQAIGGQRWRPVAPLLLVLERHVERLGEEEVARLQEERLALLCKLCVTALAVRHRCAEGEGKEDAAGAVEKAEEAAIFAVLAVLRRLEEKAREELMGMLFEWSRGLKVRAGRRRQIAFFRLCDCLASREPELLVASCAHLEIFDFASTILTAMVEKEKKKEEEKEEKQEEEEEEKEVELLLRSLLSALCAFFKAAANAGATGSLSVDETTQALIPAVAGALELTTDEPQVYRDRCTLFLLPTLAALAEACGGDEALLRPLCLEVCNRTKSGVPDVRANSLRALTAFAERLGSVFESSLLQDALPFMAECLEDDDSDVQELAFEMCERIRRQCGGDVDF